MIAIRLLVVVSLIVGFGATMATADNLTPVEILGKHLFFDTNLSTPPGMSCAACHAPETGFTGPVAELNAHGAVYPGAVHTRFGNRKPPTAAYAGDSPPLYFDDDEEVFIGGMFWDGRATGWTLGDPLAEQAQGPFLNPLEQNNPTAALVCLKVANSEYADLYEEVYGEPVDFTLGVAQTYERIARAIAAYERSNEVNPFTSKYDYYLAGQAELTEQEAWGLELFEGKALCSACHLSEPGPNGEPPLFTDFTYDNLGVPKNPENPFYTMPPKWNPARADWIDLGLGGFLAGTEYAAVAEENNGKQKVPTLRNVDKRPYPEFVKAYTHNGYFKTLEETVHFYNTRDVEEWPPPEVPENVNTDELGNLGLTADEEAAIVAFMKTLTDGYIP
jgi:cytochrome c peroxidase